VGEQIRRRLTGKPIRDRLVSLFDPDARPIRKGKLGKPTEFGYVEQLAEVTPNTKPGTRGFILPPASAPGNPGENELLPATVAELKRLRLSPREIALDGGFQTKATGQTLAPLEPERTFIAGRVLPGSKRTQRRLARYRTGAEGRISHLKRGHGLRRSRLKGSGGGLYLSSEPGYARPGHCASNACNVEGGGPWGNHEFPHADCIRPSFEALGLPGPRSKEGRMPCTLTPGSDRPTVSPWSRRSRTSSAARRDSPPSATATSRRRKSSKATRLRKRARPSPVLAPSASIREHPLEDPCLSTAYGFLLEHGQRRAL